MTHQEVVSIARYANLHLFSDVEPYEVLRVVSTKCIEIRSMSATLDPTWTPAFVSGGFAGHCTNNSNQHWVITSNTEAPVIKMRLHKDNRWHSKYGRHVLSAEPAKHYDYNF